jgi:hypothetical protein
VIATQRRRHALIWWALAVLIPLGIIGGLAARPDDPAPPSTGAPE